jgi:hypothetical protein
MHSSTQEKPIGEEDSPMPVTSPSDILRSIVAKGRRIQADIIAAKESKRGISTNAGLAVDAVNILFDLSGHKRTATRLAKKYGHASADSRIHALELEVSGWSSEAKDALRNITVLQDGIPDRPNSERLLRGFSKSMSLVRPEDRLARGILYLENLAESNIAYNNDLPGMRKAVGAMEDMDKHVIPTETEARLALLARNLEGFPNVRVAVRGALSAYEKKSDDWARQTLGSMRNALESLVKTLSGEGDWSRGLLKLIPSSSKRKPIREAYDFVSGIGTHNQDIPDQHDVELGIGLTERAIIYIIDDSKPRPKTIKTVRTQEFQLTSNATVNHKNDQKVPDERD